MSGLATLRSGLQDWLLGFDHDAALRMCGVSPGEPFGQPAGGSPPRLSFRISFLYASLLCFLNLGLSLADTKGAATDSVWGWINFLPRGTVVFLLFRRGLFRRDSLSRGESRCSHSYSRGCYSSSHRRDLHSHRYSRYR